MSPIVVGQSTAISGRRLSVYPTVVLKFLLLCCLLAQALDSFAVTRDVKFLYRPDPSVPASNAFVPVNAISCGSRVTCRANEYGVQLGSTQATRISAGPESRNTPMFRTATDWRPVTLRNGSTGGLVTANMRVVAVSGTFRFQPSLLQLVPQARDFWIAYSMLFGGDGSGLHSGWINPPSPCVGWQSTVLGNANLQTFSIRTADTPCMRPVISTINSFQITDLIIVAEIILPRPQLAQAGLYSGIQRYTVGPGMDIDFGDAVRVSDPELAINLQLEVDPLFRVEFPGGSNLLSLEPEGGWLNWLNRGRKPTRLWRDQHFNLFTSVPFKMSLQCEHSQGDHCAIAASDGHQVPVEIRLTLPNGMQDAAGQPVRRHLLNRVETPHFAPSQFILGRQATLHFEVPQPDMESMLDHAGMAYNGSVTIIWDPQI